MPAKFRVWDPETQTELVFLEISKSPYNIRISHRSPVYQKPACYIKLFWYNIGMWHTLGNTTHCTMHCNTISTV